MSNDVVLNRAVLLNGVWRVLNECDITLAPNIETLAMAIAQPQIRLVFNLANTGYSLDFYSVMVMQEHINRVEITAIAVLPDHRRQGLARGMIESIETMKRIVTWLKPDESDAQAFFTACGFRGSGYSEGRLRYVKG